MIKTKIPGPSTYSPGTCTRRVGIYFRRHLLSGWACALICHDQSKNSRPQHVLPCLWYFSSCLMSLTSCLLSLAFCLFLGLLSLVSPFWTGADSKGNGVWNLPSPWGVLAFLWSGNILQRVFLVLKEFFVCKSALCVWWSGQKMKAKSLLKFTKIPIF